MQIGHNSCYPSYLTITHREAGGFIFNTVSHYKEGHLAFKEKGLRNKASS